MLMGRRCKVSVKAEIYPNSRHLVRVLSVLVCILTFIDPYGSTESSRIDGTAISSFVSWDSKITTVNGLLGGVSGYVREKMKSDGIYGEFLQITQREYGMVFKELKGENVALCLPNAKIPDRGLVDYTNCN